MITTYKDPQQEIFTELLTELRSSYDVYDTGLPDLDAPYPFIYMANSHQIDKRRKGIITGTVNLTIHIWHNNALKRGTVSNIILDIKEKARNVKNGQYHWDLSHTDQRILLDDSTDKTLIHGILDLEFTFD